LKQLMIGGMLLLLLAGCTPAESIPGEQLSQKYPDKRYLQIDGVTLHYEQEGLGKPAVFLHSFPTSTYLWRKVIPGLAYGNTTYVLDLMGFGYSEKPQDVSYSSDTYVSQLAQFIETLHLENVALIGHGMGGTIAALYTIRHPEKVRKLIVVDAPLYQTSPPLALRLMRTWLLGEMVTSEWLLKRFLRGGVENQAVMSERVLQNYLQPYRDDPGTKGAFLKFLRQFDLDTVLQEEVIPALPRLETRTYIMWGDGDPYVPLDLAKQLERDLSNSYLQVVTNTGHFIQEDRPDELTRLLREFLLQ
jgi:pimeloyl-ACP methyl ester carboxylesterase